MYIPKHFEETRRDVLHGLIRSHPLGTLIISCDGVITANHVPFFIDPAAGESGVLRCHVAKSNPVWKAMCGTEEALVVFQGPDSYISPSWYPSKEEHGKAVPTWDYVVVHARGVPKTTDDSNWLLRHVSELSRTHESNRAVPWKVSDAPADYIKKRLNAIVGIEIPISHLEGKWKVSQNRPEADHTSIVAGLEAQDDDKAKALSRMIRELLL